MSAQPKFTPGPWKWWTSCSWIRLSSEARGHNKDGGVLCPTVSRSDGHPDLIVSEADMALIAAAPDLYRALDLLAEVCEYSHLREIAAAALAKAEGRQP